MGDYVSMVEEADNVALEHTSADKKTLKLVSLTTTFAQLPLTTNAPIVMDVPSPSIDFCDRF